MTPKVVYDTNLIVSAALKTESLPASLVALAISRHVRLFYSPAILEEYTDVLKRQSFASLPAGLRLSFRISPPLLSLSIFTATRTEWLHNIIIAVNMNIWMMKEYNEEFAYYMQQREAISKEIAAHHLSVEMGGDKVEASKAIKSAEAKREQLDNQARKLESFAPWFELVRLRQLLEEWGAGSWSGR
jgi:hypothetical protein